MKYFTAERYNAVQDDDNNGDDWEHQLTLYDARLKEIDNKLPASVKKFMATCHLHDADFDIWQFLSLTSRHRVQLVVRQQNWGDFKYLCVLRYTLALPGHQDQVDWQDQPVTTNLNKGPGFYHENPAWLYDEWEYLGSAVNRTINDDTETKVDLFSHSFLLSNGAEVRIVFSEFEFLLVPMGDGVVEGQ